MFVCDKCINNYVIMGDFESLSLFSHSYGTCEDCRIQTDCFDLPHNSYAHKNSVVGEALIKEGKTTIGFQRITLAKEYNLDSNPSRRY